MALTGSLADFGVTDVLQLIKIQRKSGVLAVTARERSVTLAFQDGDMVMAHRSGLSLANAVGRALVRDEVLREADWGKLTRRCNKPGARIDQLLAKRFGVDAAEVARHASHYIRQTALSLFGWLEGDYRFEAGALLEMPMATPPAPVDTDHVLMTGVGNEDEWRHIRTCLPSDLSVLSRTEAAADIRDPLLHWVDGRRAVWQLADLSPLDWFETSSALARWVVDGVLTVQQPNATGRTRKVQPAVRTGRRAQQAMAVLVAAGCMAVVLGCGWWVADGPRLPWAGTATELLYASQVTRDHQVREALSGYYLLYQKYPQSLAELADTGWVADPGMFSGMSYQSREMGYSLHLAQG